MNILSEEMVDPTELMADGNVSIAAVGKILEIYKVMLNEKNLMDFSTMQTEAYKLLKEHADVLGELQSKITHIMVDDYG